MGHVVIAGTVQVGRRQGRRIGFPTINLRVPRTVEKDDWGIYFSLVAVDDRILAGVTHLGPAKTFGLRAASCETYVLRRNLRELAGEKVRVRLLFKFRSIEHFTTVQALRRQIRRDVQAAMKFFHL